MPIRSLTKLNNLGTRTIATLRGKPYTESQLKRLCNTIVRAIEDDDEGRYTHLLDTHTGNIAERDALEDLCIEYHITGDWEGLSLWYW